MLDHPPMNPGELRQHVLLRTRAIYRIEEIERDHVWVSVVSAPGLQPGERVKMTKGAVEAMRVVGQEAADMQPLPPLTDETSATPRKQGS
jgi:hypothetical protein